MTQHCASHTAAPKLSIHERSRLTGMLMQLFDHWQLPVRDQLTLLGVVTQAGANNVLTHLSSGALSGTLSLS